MQAPTDEVARLRLVPSRLLSRAALLASRLVTEELEAVGGHRHVFAVLVTLDELGPSSQAELCRRCGLDRSDMTAIVTALEGDGYASRAVDPADGRRKVVRLRPTGRSRLAELEDAVAAAQDALLEGWSTEDRARLVMLLERLLEA